jgi:GDPmannose 4,6-dehydratase|tara:strand:+ start:19169 stop:20152 length:984 start_codon:yes stop_codon:yes gene_type:complete
MKTALITGITGQDGSYLAELLLSKGYRVVGVKRRTSLITTDRIDTIFTHPNLILEYGSLHDAGCFWKLLNKYQPDEIYNLAAQSHVRVSFSVPEETVDSIVMGTLRLMNAYKELCPTAKFYQASSSEMFGDNLNIPFDEESRLRPASPYACAKVFSHNLMRNYRESYGLHASSGILFNHESPRRGETFVTRKITIAAARIKLGLQEELFLGNLDAKRDWGFAGDYVKAMWLMMQQKKPDDYVIATGKSYTVREFLKYVFEYAGLNDVEKYVKIDSRLFRPHEVPYLLGNPTKAQENLGWKPKINFKQLAEMMYDADYKLVKNTEVPK